MAVLSSRGQERRSREIRARGARERAAKPQSPRGFSALARLYYLARPTKTAMLRRLSKNWESAEMKRETNFRLTATGSINVDKWLKKITKISCLLYSWLYKFMKHTETITTLSQNRVQT